MKLTNVSNYPRTIRGIRIEPGQTEEVKPDAATKQQLKASSKFEVEEDDSAADKVESEDDAEETSKPEQKSKEGEN